MLNRNTVLRLMLQVDEQRHDQGFRTQIDKQPRLDSMKKPLQPVFHLIVKKKYD